mgnify:CR=1 FL=1
MKFLLEMLGMTNQCNLNCTYCDWKKEPYHSMTEEEYLIARKNIEKTREIMDESFPEYCLMQYSGGEPFLYPRIIEDVLDVYHDKWIRLNTNGLSFPDSIISKIKEHGKTYVAVSIDGFTMKSMAPRIGTQENLLKKILDNLDMLISKEIPVMILCTLSIANITDFPSFVDYLESKYSDAIAKGMLAMPAHCVTSYSVKHDEVEDSEIIDKFENYIKNEAQNHILLKYILPHYEHMIYYLRHNDRMVLCTISDWTISMHFRGNSIIDDSHFLSFGCGMRGVRDLGAFDINDSKDISLFVNKLQYVEENKKEEFRFKEYDVGGEKECNTKCFPDWIMFDLILTGQASSDNAQKWFVLFKDKKVKDFIKYFSEKYLEIEYKAV